MLTGSFDARGGNVLFPAVPTPGVGSEGPPQPERPAVGLGAAERPLGPARWGFATTDELYRGIIDRKPYAVRGLVGFGANLLLSHGDVLRGREALAALDFYVHADLFMNPTSELADVVLPVASGFEREALKLGFEVSHAAQSLVQLRRPVAAPPGEARSDTEIVFELAVGLGLGDYFWEGNIDAAYRHQLGPSGLSLDWLRDHPEGARVALETRYRKFADKVDGVPLGFNTPTHKIELYSETLLAHAHRDARRERACAGAAERYPAAGCGLRAARLVAAVPGRGSARLRAVQSRRRELQPHDREQGDRPDQRVLASPSVPLRDPVGGVSQRPMTAPPALASCDARAAAPGRGLPAERTAFSSYRTVQR